MKARAICAAAIVALGAARARAQTKPDHPVAPAKGEDAQAEARNLGERGLALFEESKWEEAFAAFSQANALYHAPTLVLYMANCRKNQGKLVEARALYLQVAAEALPRVAPDRFKKAQATARAEAEALDKRIATVRIAVAGPVTMGPPAAPNPGPAEPGPRADRVRITIDGAPVAADAAASGMPIDPGEHTFAAEVDRSRESVSVTIAPGESKRIEIALAAPPAEKPRPLVPAGIAFGVSGAALVIGAATGAVALGKISDLHAACPMKADGAWHCPPASASADADLASKVSSAHTLSNTAYAMVTVGVIAGAAGAAIVVLRPSFLERAAAFTQLRVLVGPRSLGFEGRF